MNKLENMIIEMELKLLDKNIRDNRNELIKYISKDFIEYGSSGKIYTYDETINISSKKEAQIIYKIASIKTKILAENIILVLYTIETENGNEKIVTNRSSIWKNETDNWRILFHQGTKVK